MSQSNIATHGFRWQVGVTCLRLRDWWIFAILVGLAAAALAILPRYAVDKNGVVLDWALLTVTILGIVAAMAAIADRIADWHSRRLEKLEVLSQQSAGSRALAPIISLLDEVHDGAFVSGKAREDRWVTLRASLASAAANGPVADNVRATYYPLTKTHDNWRELKNPKSRGRTDEASTVFLEADDPTHPVWSIMDARDTECVVTSFPNKECRVQWESRPYKTFISVPVKADGVQFGMLSINAVAVGDLTEIDRLSAIAMARIMATVLALESGANVMSIQRDLVGNVGSTSYAETSEEKEV